MAVIAAGPRAPDHARSARWMWTLLALAALTRSCSSSAGPARVTTNLAPE